MFIRTLVFAAALLGVPGTVSSQQAHAESRENCATFAPLIRHTSSGFSELWSHLAEIDFLHAGARVGGDAGRKLADLRFRIESLTPDIDELTAAFDETARSLQACAE